MEFHHDGKAFEKKNIYISFSVFLFQDLTVIFLHY